MEVKREEGLGFLEGERKNFLGREIEGLEKQERRGVALVLVDDDAKALNILLRDVSDFCLREEKWNREGLFQEAHLYIYIYIYIYYIFYVFNIYL